MQYPTRPIPDRPVAHATASAAPPATAAERSDFVQCMRFVAAALVLVTHATFYFHERVSSDVAVWHFGEIGVPLFFVISGLVMMLSSAALPLQPAGARVFMRRRLLRVVPLYWLATSIKVAIALLVPAVVLHNHFDVAFAIKSYLFVPTFNPAGEVVPIHGVGWTLLHEMYFYIAFAAAMALGLRPLRVVSVFITAFCVYGALWAPQSAWMTVAVHPVNLCFVVGMWVGWGVMGDASYRANAISFGLLLVAVVGFATRATGAESLLPSPVVLVVAAAFLLLASWRMPKAARWPIALGNSSYALYLFHPFFTPPILLAAHKLLPNSPAYFQIAFAVVLVLVLAHLLHLWVEQPLVRRVQSLWR